MGAICQRRSDLCPLPGTPDPCEYFHQGGPLVLLSMCPEWTHPSRSFQYMRLLPTFRRWEPHLQGCPSSLPHTSRRVLKALAGLALRAVADSGHPDSGLRPLCHLWVLLSAPSPSRDLHYSWTTLSLHRKLVTGLSAAAAVPALNSMRCPSVCVCTSLMSHRPVK